MGLGSHICGGVDFLLVGFVCLFRAWFSFAQSRSFYDLSSNYGTTCLEIWC